MNFDDYENLPNAKLSVTMFAGASAGIMEHISMYPIDTIKVMYHWFLGWNANETNNLELKILASEGRKKTVENGRRKKYYINS